MSHRFPPLTPPADLSISRARVLTIPDALSLPWLELALGLALFLVLRLV